MNFKKIVFLSLMTILGFYFSVTLQAANIVTAARVWPALDYTRITLESAQPFVYKMSLIQNPDRVVVDIENVDLNQVVKSLSDKILASDPYIKQIRVAKFQQNVVRMVVDLKTEAKPNAFTLLPTGEYKYRLVLDVYPLKDPLMAMIAERDAASNPVSSMQAEGTNQVVAQESSNINSNQSHAVIESIPSQVESVDQNVTKTTKTVDIPKSTELPITKVDIKEKFEAKAQESSQVNSQEATQTKIKKNGRQIVIAIDAGNGGEDPGARGANGSHEKDVTLMIAKKLKEKIDSEPNMRGVLTRDSDFFIPLHGRVVKARNMQADLFVSIHADAFTNQLAKGSSVFALSERGATSASARYLAKKENESDLIGGVSLDDKDPLLARTLLDLSQTATISDSVKQC